MDFKRRQVLLDNSQLGPYPLEKLPRVDRPTNRYVGEVQQRSQTENVFFRADRGEFGPKVQEGWWKVCDQGPLLYAMNQFQVYLSKYSLPDESAERAPIPEDPRILTRHIKKFAYFLGADMVGICKLPKSAVYSEWPDGSPLELDAKYAIVLLNVKQTDAIRCSYGFEWIDDPISYQAYQRCACQAQVIASYIRKLGWKAETSVLKRYHTLMPQLVIESGLGEASRLGIALNPFVGASFKVSGVLTDLPLEADKPMISDCRTTVPNAVFAAITVPRARFQKMIRLSTTAMRPGK